MTERPDFREPWTHGARAYREADTMEALERGMRRKRNIDTVLMPMEAVGHLDCMYCGGKLGEPYEVNKGQGDLTTDQTGRVEYHPRKKEARPYHYYCGWGATMKSVLDYGRAIQLG